jgi:hypothetical protein
MDTFSECIVNWIIGEDSRKSLPHHIDDELETADARGALQDRSLSGQDGSVSCLGMTDDTGIRHRFARIPGRPPIGQLLKNNAH